MEVTAYEAVPAWTGSRGRHLQAADQENFDIAEEIAQARQEIEDAYNNFQNACDPDLIDCYIYRGNAAWKRYCFLLRQAKAIHS